MAKEKEWLKTPSLNTSQYNKHKPFEWLMFEICARVSVEWCEMEN